MRNLRGMLILVVVIMALQSCVAIDDRQMVSCGGNHRLQIVNLDMAPDPIAQGQRIDRFLVRLRADGSGECRTVLRVREEGEKDLIGQERVYGLRPGINEIVIEPYERYRFSRNEHCFVVLADIAGTARPPWCRRRSSQLRMVLSLATVESRIEYEADQAYRHQKIRSEQPCDSCTRIDGGGGASGRGGRWSRRNDRRHS